MPNTCAIQVAIPPYFLNFTFVLLRVPSCSSCLRGGWKTIAVRDSAARQNPECGPGPQGAIALSAGGVACPQGSPASGHRRATRKPIKIAQRRTRMATAVSPEFEKATFHKVAV